MVRLKQGQGDGARPARLPCRNGMPYFIGSLGRTLCIPPQAGEAVSPATGAVIAGSGTVIRITAMRVARAAHCGWARAAVAPSCGSCWKLSRRRKLGVRQPAQHSPVFLAP